MPTSTIDYFVSVYTLEHLFNLQAACYEMVRVLKPNGILIAALPIEENIFINIIRKFTSCKVLKKEYDIDYSKIIYYEHCNYTKQILRTLSYFFDIEYISYFPLKIPILPINFNVTIKAKVKSFLKKELR